ncbi:uncharacterized protein LOC110044854 [Orbicella faveolata]|uniref:uncharacterized protein LOC110044854 n=1 Tax=Orbicella faveolata TaxID=48498 RepID=UPI0009E3A1B1|nr:uncharacterized protein LOC110044854 [Orbicella faveolata]
MFLAYYLRLQFWILHKQVIDASQSCLTTDNHTKSLLGADIMEIEKLYCNGFDLERPLLLSLSTCSNKHKEEVRHCLSNFAATFSKSFLNPSLCRKRDEAKQCISHAWRTYCNPSDEADGIQKEVIGSFNPFCDGDKDSMAEKSDQCTNYTTLPCQNPDDEGCPGASQPERSV